MLDEPYRWLEAVQNRREYIEDRLKEGSPVIGVAYNQGLLLLTFTGGQPKVFEIYDRMAFSAVGHPADIEKLRMQVIDMAHVEGFTKSQADVTLHRLVNFGLMPLLKQAFDTVLGSPFITKLLVVELGRVRHPNQFYAINYDGEVQTHASYGVVAGDEEIDHALTAYLQTKVGDAPPMLHEAIRSALLTWALGNYLTEAEDSSESPPDETLWEIVQEWRQKAQIDVAVLDEDQPGSSKFRKLTEPEIQAALAESV